MPSRHLSPRTVFERLDTDECRRLLGTRGFGRLCFGIDGRVHVVLTAYVLHGGSVYVRSSAFGLAARRVEAGPMTLQVDDMPADGQAGWSVTVTGTAHRVVDAVTLAELWSPVRPMPWGTDTDGLWIGLSDADVVGLRRVV